MTYQENVRLLDSYLEWISNRDKLEGELLIKYYQVDFFLRHFPVGSRYGTPINFYRRALLNRNLAVYDLWNYKSLNEQNSITIHNAPKVAPAGPKIYCAFHFGSYRTIGCVLFERGVSFSVVASSSIIKDNKEFLEPLRNFAASSGRENDFDIINVNENAAIMSMIRCLRQGKSLLVYIDGTNGLGDFNITEEKLLAVSFLNKQINSRQGVAFLSHRLGVPIIPVISWREYSFQHITVEFFDEIIPTQDKEMYIPMATQSLWDTFSSVFMKDPAQWECVFYSSAFIAPSASNNLGQAHEIDPLAYYSFNATLYDFYTTNTDFFLYHFNSSKMIRIPLALYRLLSQIKTEGLSFTPSEFRQLLSEFTLRDLVEKQILTC